MSRHGARCVLLDVTGVARIDAQVAHALGQTQRAASLLGARVRLVGVRPELAMRLVGLDIDLGELSSHQSLASALEDLASTEVPSLRTRRNAAAEATPRSSRNAISDTGRRGGSE